MSVLVLDTETTGLDFEKDDIIQLAWNIYDSRGKMIKKRNRYIETERVITNSHIHNITNEKLEEKGISFYDAMVRLISDLKEFDVNLIVCHNKKFDLGMIESNCSRKYIDCSRLSRIESYCTMMNSARKYGKGRWLKLSKLYECLFNKDTPINLHNAVNDAKITAECYFKMVGVKDDDSDSEFEV